MNDDLNSLALLLAQAQRQRDEALALQFKLEAACRAADAQAEQLVSYRREYEARWHAEFCREGKIELVRCYQGFMQRLTQAVEQQQGIARHAAGEAEHSAMIVRSHELRAAALKKMAERRHGEGRLAAARLEQKEHDDHAARAAWARSAVASARGAA